jgi:hypothetical protein
MVSGEIVHTVHRSQRGCSDMPYNFDMPEKSDLIAEVCTAGSLGLLDPSTDDLPTIALRNLV